jgi:hypothetical protein
VDVSGARHGAAAAAIAGSIAIVAHSSHVVQSLLKAFPPGLCTKLLLLIPMLLGSNIWLWLQSLLWPLLLATWGLFLLLPVLAELLGLATRTAHTTARHNATTR